MVEWAIIKKKAVTQGQLVEPDLTEDEVFGKGPIAPGTGDKGDNANDGTNPIGKTPDGDKAESKEGKSGEKRSFGTVDERDHTRIVKALIEKGYKPDQAQAIAYDIIESGKFDENKLPKGK